MSKAAELRRKAAQIHKPLQSVVNHNKTSNIDCSVSDSVKRGKGRPKKVIDYDQVFRLGKIHCTISEIASHIGVSVSVLQNDQHFQLVYNKGMDKGKKSLRRVMYQLADKGNVTMLVWLSKNLMGFRDNKALELSGADGKPITFKVVYD